MQKSTKIIATIGPASDSKEIISKMFEHGMNVARLNCSHGSHAYFSKVIDTIRDVSEDICILLDTKGPEVRVGRVMDPVHLEHGMHIELTNRDIIASRDSFSIRYPHLNEIGIGSMIRIDDGLISLEVIGRQGKNLVAKVIDGGELIANKSCAIQGHNVRLPFLSAEDRKDIRFGVKKDVSIIAASFVRSQEDVAELRRLVRDQMIISKIEHWKALEHIHGIIEASDGAMVARGDLGAQLSLERVPKIQQEIIRECNVQAKPVIVATQMLESMKDNPRPTRAEVSDVAQAILQGADAVMLSAETGIGKYPVQAVHMMAKIAREYDHLVEGNMPSQHLRHTNVAQFVTEAAFHSTRHLHVKAILTPTETGFTARNVARYRPRVPIYAITRSMRVSRQLALTWGVHPICIPKKYTDLHGMIAELISETHKRKLVDREDTVVVTAGHRLRKKGSTNLLEIHKVKDILK